MYDSCILMLIVPVHKNDLKHYVCILSTTTCIVANCFLIIMFKYHT